MLAVVTMIAAVEAKAEDYVFMYNGHYLANISGQISDVTTFNPTTCIWNGTSGGTFTNQGYYLRHYQTDGTFTLRQGADGDWTNLSIYGQVLYRNESGRYATRYLRYNNGWVADRNNYTNVVYEVTISDVAPIIGALTITAPANVLNRKGDFTFTHNTPTYQAGYTNYYFNNANH